MADTTQQQIDDILSSDSWRSGDPGTLAKLHALYTATPIAPEPAQPATPAKPTQLDAAIEHQFKITAQPPAGLSPDVQRANQAELERLYKLRESRESGRVPHEPQTLEELAPASELREFLGVTREPLPGELESRWDERSESDFYQWSMTQGLSGQQVQMIIDNYLAYVVPGGRGATGPRAGDYEAWIGFLTDRNAPDSPHLTPQQAEKLITGMCANLGIDVANIKAPKRA